MKESIEKRIEKVRDAESPEDLIKHLCPFFADGGSPECTTCKKTEAVLDTCKNYYLERIIITPMDIWSEEFDRFSVTSRDKVSLEDVVGVGINCDSCYMSEKCSVYRKGYTCGIEWANGKPSNPTEFVDFLINTQYERVKRSAVFEKIDGGVPDAGLSGEMDRLHNLVAYKIDMGRERLSINVEATGAARPEGGILAKLFGGGSSLSEKKHVELPETSATREDIGEITDFVEVKEKEEVKIPRQRKSKL